MRRRRCEHCTGIASGRKARCPLCNRRLAYALPTKEQIQEECDEILRLHPKGKTRPGIQGWQVPGVSRSTDHMRRNDSEKEGGR